MTALETRVLSFARGKSGQQVGNGECWTLAERAITQNGGASSRDLTPDDGDFARADYVWGEPVSLSRVRPGNILQFRDYSVAVRRTASDGGWQEQTFTYRHHTSIVATAPDGHNKVSVWHQNVEDDGDPTKKLVVRRDVYLQSTTFHSGGEAVRVTVSGRIWAYSPQPASE